MTKTIRQTVYINASPHDVFEALMDAKRHARFTGDKAKIDRKVGGAFSTFGGYATGTTLKPEKDKLIVQTWRTTEFAKDDADSRVMIHPSKKGKGTRLTFVQSDVPDGLVANVRRGWIDFYWTPLKAYLGSPTA